MTILITGGAGFIGANFAREWLAVNSEPIVILDKLTYAGNRESLVALLGDDRHTFVEGDISDTTTLHSLLVAHKPRAIVHLAAESHVDRSIAGPGEFIMTNVVGTFQLLRTALAYWSSLEGASRDEFRLVHVSTDEVYGSIGTDEPPASESAPYRPSSPYAASKAGSDHLVEAYGRTYGLPIVITNCTNNYGPLQYPEKLIPVIIAAGISGQAIPVYARGQNIRDWLHVSDHCAALRLILQRGKPGESYNVGAGNEVKNIDLVHRICGLLDELDLRAPVLPHARLVKFVADRPGHDFRYALDASKLRRELGWAPIVDFDAGLRGTVNWYLSNRRWVETVLARAVPQVRL